MFVIFIWFYTNTESHISGHGEENTYQAMHTEHMPINSFFFFLDGYVCLGTWMLFFSS